MIYFLYRETTEEQFNETSRNYFERTYRKIQKTTKTQRPESFIHFTYVTPAVLLYWISAFGRIKPVARMWPCKLNSSMCPKVT